jgi:hypothetical protein
VNVLINIVMNSRDFLSGDLGWVIMCDPETFSVELFTEEVFHNQVMIAQCLSDTLLPKFISVEIQMEDEERFLEERLLGERRTTNDERNI